MKRKAWFSSHALQRASEYGLLVQQVLTSFDRSTKYELKSGEKMYKFSVYGMRSLGDFYYYDPKSFLLFTCNDKDDKLVVITITKKGQPI